VGCISSDRPSHAGTETRRCWQIVKAEIHEGHRVPEQSRRANRGQTSAVGLTVRDNDCHHRALRDLGWYRARASDSFREGSTKATCSGQEYGECSLLCSRLKLQVRIGSPQTPEGLPLEWNARACELAYGANQLQGLRVCPGLTLRITPWL